MKNLTEGCGCMLMAVAAVILFTGGQWMLDVARALVELVRALS